MPGTHPPLDATTTAATPAGEPAWLRAGRIPSLDGLRAVAILLVLFAHVCKTRGFPDVPFLRAIGRRGGFGVEVFFVISGFLITNLMLRERFRSGRLDVGRFYLRRVRRITPAYVCLLLAVAAMQATGQAHLTIRDWLGAATYTVNFLRQPAWEIGHAWSLSIEEHFYLVWPFVMAMAPRSGRLVTLGCLAFCFALRWVILLAFPAESVMAGLWTFTRLDSIATGCLLAFLAWDETWPASGPGLSGRPGRRRGVAAPDRLARPFRLQRQVRGRDRLQPQLALRRVTRLGRDAGTGTSSWKALNHDWVMTIGVASYSIYLWQQIFLDGKKSALPYAFPQNLVFACAAAFVSYRFVETPFLKLKSRIEHRADSCASGASRHRATRATTSARRRSVATTSPSGGDGRLPAARGRRGAVIFTLCWAYAASVLAVLVLVRWLGDVSWLATLVLYGPRWVWAAPLAVLIPSSAVFRRRGLAPLAAAAWVVAGPLMGFCLPWRLWLAPELGDIRALRVMTLNVHGTTADRPSLARLITETAPDVVALQEWPDRSDPVALFPGDGWFVRVDGQFLLASRYRIGNVTTFSPTRRGRLSAVRYALDTPAGAVDVVNTHLSSVRGGLEQVVQLGRACRLRT